MAHDSWWQGGGHAVAVTDGRASIVTTQRFPRPSDEEVESARALALRAGFEYVNLNAFDVDISAAPVLPERVARRAHSAAIGWRYGLPVVAVSRPDDLMLLSDIRAATGRDVHTVVACPSQIDAFLDAFFGAPEVDEASGLEPAPVANVPAPVPQRAAAEEPMMLLAQPEDASTGVPQPAPTQAAAPVPPVATTFAPEPVPVIAEFEPVPEPQPEPVEPVVLDPEPVAEAQEGVVELDDTAEPLTSESQADETPSGTPETLLVAEPLAAPTPFGSSGHEIAGRRLTLEEILVRDALISPDEMETVLLQRASSGRSLREVIAELKIVSDEQLLRAVAEEAGLEFVDLNGWSLDQAAADLIPESLARRYHILAIGFRGIRPVIAMANPSDVFALDDVRSLLGRDIEAVICTAAQIDEYLVRLYKRSDEAGLVALDAAHSTSASEATPGADIKDLHAVVDDAPIVKFVNLILRQALDERASDVHIEPTVDDLQVRFRIDGVLHHVTSSPKAIQGGVITRLKVMADLDIAEHRVPQDGRISLSAGGREIDLRVATLPTVNGEKVVLRVLDKSTAPLDLARLGFRPEVLERYEMSYRKPYGTILVTGPTGSGKSTTLYATLNKLNSPERNLITVEDPVEFQLRGINQVQVSPKTGLTFAGALRSILRSDPDVVLVGEIRDRETATIAIEAALTGHLVLTCLHTNDASSTPLRLIEMGVEPFLVGSAIDCVLAQRLARLLCDVCAEPYEPTAAELRSAGWRDDDAPEDGIPKFRKAVGCQACGRTGYRGRLAIHEALLMTEEIERLVLARAQTDDVQRLAVEQGMCTLRHDGLRKAGIGLTSLEEILRVVL